MRHTVQLKIRFGLHVKAHMAAVVSPLTHDLTPTMHECVQARPQQWELSITINALTISPHPLHP